MTLSEKRICMLSTPETEAHLADLYGKDDGTVRRQKERYAALIRRHAETFGEKEGVELFSAPGRTEIGGNHTDHNRGRVLAASVNLDTLCAASPREDMAVHFHSEGYPALTVDLNDTDPRKEEEGTTASLIRGVADGMKRAGYTLPDSGAAGEETAKSAETEKEASGAKTDASQAQDAADEAQTAVEDAANQAQDAADEAQTAKQDAANQAREEG